ncbi:hypothetical protein ACILG0_16620 [Pseudomonadota bacterium AL_CKDN230030165-1A_HGKHYDSX7]
MTLTSLAVAHFWNVACFALAVAGLHGLLAVWLLRLRRAAPPRWCLRLASGLVLTGAVGLIAGNLLRAQSLAGLQAALVEDVQAICRAADERVTQLGGRAATDDPATRQRVAAALHADFREVVRTHFSLARYTPLAVVSPRGAESRYGDLVIRVSDRARSAEPMHVGCYNQYAHPPGSIGFGATPYWRAGAGEIPPGNVVFFWQERAGDTSRVDYGPPAARP